MVTDIIQIDSVEMILKLGTALLLGMSLGIERAIAGKTAGMRTYGLVTMGSALFVIISIFAAGGLSSQESIRESLRFSSQILPGIGFIGAGLIIFRGSKISGITTAAGIWVSAGIGASVGYGLYFLAVAATVLALIIFTSFWYIENKVKALAHFSHED